MEKEDIVKYKSLLKAYKEKMDNIEHRLTCNLCPSKRRKELKDKAKYQALIDYCKDKLVV